MLAFLKVSGFAIIDELEIEFGDGLNVITGETGAGKSIIMNALSTLVDAKTPQDVVRKGADQAEVVGHFMEGDEEHILKRVIHASGRSRAFLNGDAVTLARLEDIGNNLVSIYGQNESKHLLEREGYVMLLDGLLGVTAQREALGSLVERLRRTKGELNKLGVDTGGRLREISLLEYQLREIEKAALREGEEEELKERVKMLRDADRIRLSLEGIVEGFYEGEQSVHGVLSASAGMLRPFGHIGRIEDLGKKLEGIGLEVEDLVMEARSILKGLACDPEELEKAEERLSFLYDLRHKYGGSVASVLRYAEEAGQRLAYLAGLTGTIETLEKEIVLLESEIDGAATDLSQRRKEGASPIAKRIEEEIGRLSMKGAAFQISLTDRGTVDEKGRDDVEFLLSTNPGEPLKPLRRVASGGELSRIMLAIKKVVGGDEDKTLIFDEVDAGIGGRVADVVGQRLRDLAGTHQVICITHLPQIAVYGDRHFLVEKQVEGQRTGTGIRNLSSQERVQEIARMLGGSVVTEKTLQRAEEMLGHD